MHALTRRCLPARARRPDLNTDELLSKRANVERVKMFSRNLRVINRKDEEEAIARREQAEAASPGAKAAAAKELSKHQKAKEYARMVPKPRVREKQGGAEEVTEVVDVEDELDALALLEKQHNEYKAQAALIRAELGI